MERKVEKGKQKISVHGKKNKNEGFVLLKTLIYVSCLLVLVGGVLICYINLMNQNNKNFKKAIELINERNLQVENEINRSFDFDSDN